MKRLFIGGAAVLLTVVVYHVGRARANGIPQTNTMAYTGTLLQSGQPATGTHSLAVQLCDQADTACASPLCSTGLPQSIAVTNGRFTIGLPSGCVTAVHQDPTINVQLYADGSTLPLSPLTAVPYAVEADTASNAAAGSALAGTLQQLVPSGTIIAYAGPINPTATPSVLPDGWLLCDGSTVSQAQYPALYQAIGTSAGNGNGDGETFSLPDYRGRFLRGLNQPYPGDGATNDPDAATRTAMASGGNTGDAIGTVEGEQIQSHSHPITDKPHTHSYQASGLGVGGTVGSAIYGTNVLTTYTTAPAYTGITTTENNGGSETRPVNAAVNYLIKY